jgi:hypothetical protein
MAEGWQQKHMSLLLMPLLSLMHLHLHLLPRTTQPGAYVFPRGVAVTA